MTEELNVRWSQRWHGLLIWSPRCSNTRLLCQKRQHDGRTSSCGGYKSKEETVAHKSLIPFYTGSNFFRSSWVWKNLFLFMETERRVLRHNHSAGLERSQQVTRYFLLFNFMFSWIFWFSVTWSRVKTNIKAQSQTMQNLTIQERKWMGKNWLRCNQVRAQKTEYLITSKTVP